MGAKPLIFGVYPGGIVGTPTGLSESKPDDPARINGALDQLQGNGSSFLVRAYLHFAGPGAPASSEESHPADALQYAINGRKLNLVLCFRDAGGDISAWTAFVRDKIRSHAEHLATLSVTLEPNLSLPNVALDGNFPAVVSALVHGIAAARDEVDRMGIAVDVGFCASPTFGPKVGFWSELEEAGGKGFVEALDYVGLDFYADVFYPVAPDGEAGDLKSSVLQQLHEFRYVDLPAAGIPSPIPIHIGENGWPTSSARSPQKQAQVLDALVRTIHEVRAEFNITYYQWFSLRDSDSTRDEIFSQFGLMRDDYAPKPAFDVFRQLIAELE